MSENKFFKWVTECCDLMGWPHDRGAELLPANDPCWFWCFDDGMTPAAAVAKFQKASAEPPVMPVISVDSLPFPCHECGMERDQYWIGTEPNRECVACGWREIT